ncbi:foldase protein PrsA [Bacillus pakistanensis]|uniref:peptidylprolyl isomerase n=1 Tax=Rossellomorea pakistanensis TaxID=992288 RepID=A0ABS2NK50_9BACI|nr:peptidyl-prolyl cis-trans isomerase [Bacillus pakistanensis]MBM7588209.1 foldase protein PrsA [Bacillus pakistanensis]
MAKLKLNRRGLMLLIALLVFSNVLTLTLWLLNTSNDTSVQSGNETVATVGKEQISRENWLHAMDEKYGKVVLQDLVNQSVMKQLAKKYDIVITDEEVEKEIQLLQSMYRSLGENDHSDHKDVFAKEEIRMELMLQEIMTRDVNISEEDVKAFFEENKKRYSIPTMYKLSQIVVKTKKEAEQVITELEEGSSFSAMAIERSIDAQTATQGGVLGYIPEDAELISDSVEKKIKDLGPLEWTTPTKIDEGYYIFLLHEKVEGKTYAFEDVKDTIRRQLALDQVDQPLTPEDFWKEIGVDWFYKEEQ